MYYVNKLNNVCDILYDGWNNDEQSFTQMVLDFTPWFLTLLRKWGLTNNTT